MMQATDDLPRWIQTLPWDQLTELGIRTTGTGPFEEDFYWQLVTGDRLLELPSAAVTGAAWDELGRRLPGFDYARVIMAATSHDDRVFGVWDRELPVAADAVALAARFTALIARLGGDAAAAPEIAAALLARWTAPARRYHNAQHLAACLYELDAAAGARDTVELALWYHDAIYEPGAPDCEARSAELLRHDAAALAIEAAPAAALVLATAHASDAPVGDAATDLVLDIDLSILGARPRRFLDYDDSIREEYAAIPASTFYPGRARFLAGLLARPRLFRTAAFHERLEARARASIAALLSSPRYRV